MMFFEDSKTKLDKQIDLVCAVWNKYALSLGFKEIRKITPERRIMILQRMRSFTYKDFRDCIRMLHRVPHLRDQQWFSFDFLIRSDNNLAKFLEGNYDRPFGVNNQYSSGSAVSKKKHKF